ncbi:MAG: hypothetical protein HOI80_04675, partial [Alphaproteobacteria bacterium]|nr:hypothetical protein [Alphaproteobacteria bacterium]
LFSPEYIESTLKKQFPKSEEDVIQKVSRLSLGRTGRALDLMNYPEKRAYFLKLYKDILYLLGTDNIVERFSYVEDLVEDEKQRRDFLGVMTHVLRAKILESDQKDARGKLIEMVSKTQDAGILLKQNVNTRLVLENLMLV